MRRLFLILCSGFFVIAILTAGVMTWPDAAGVRWTDRELQSIRSLWSGNLPPLPPDPSNQYGDNPDAASFGHRLFFDTRLSSNGRVSCATCHKPDRSFQDDLPRAAGVGAVPRRTMPVAGTAYSPWMFWDGRKDSQWSQALGPLESAVEHGGTRLQYAHIIASHYRDEYEAIFGPLPDLSGLPHTGGPVEDSLQRAAWETLSPDDKEAVTRVFVNMGKAIAAYERTLQLGPARFDRYVENLAGGGTKGDEEGLSKDEIAGLRLFIGKAQCINCHNGPLFTDHDFHNTGVTVNPYSPDDAGRALGARQVLDDEFNCLSPFSDAAPEDCAELRFMLAEGENLVRAYRAPSLRGAVDRPPYMHAGQIATIEDVLKHYNTAPEAPAGHSELKPLQLSKKELHQLEAFLHTLSSPIVAPPGFLENPHREQTEISSASTTETR